MSRGKPWTETELKNMTELYGTMPNKQLQKDYIPNRSVPCIQQKAIKMGLTTRQVEPFNTIETSIVKQYILGEITGERAATLTGRSIDSIHAYAFRLKRKHPELKSHKNKHNNDVMEVIEWYIQKEITAKEAAELTDQTVEQIYSKASRLRKKINPEMHKQTRTPRPPEIKPVIQIAKTPNQTKTEPTTKPNTKQNSAKPWTQQEDQVILKYDTLVHNKTELTEKMPEIMTQLPGRSRRSIITRRRILGCKPKSANYKPGMTVENFTLIKKTGKNHWACQCECGRIHNLHIRALSAKTELHCKCQTETRTEKALNNYADRILKDIARYETISHNQFASYTLGLFGL